MTLMKKSILFMNKSLLMLAHLLAIVFMLCSCSQDTAEHDLKDNEKNRIISMSPAMTEALFALGLGDDVVGVSRFCTYPEAVSNLPKVGGFLDPDIEGIVRLKPTCVVMQQGENDIGAKLGAFGLNILFVKSSTLDEILASFDTLGNAFGRKQEGQAIRNRIENALKHANGQFPERKIVLVIWREIGDGIRDMQVAGADGYYNEIFRHFNCTLLPATKLSKYPTLSAEGILELAPDFIIELQPGMDEKRVQMSLDDWHKSLPALSCPVKIITDECAVVPGPRLEQFCSILEEIF